MTQTSDDSLITSYLIITLLFHRRLLDNIKERQSSYSSWSWIAKGLLSHYSVTT